MANLFVNLPAPAANGAGAAVDVSAFGKTKSIVCGGGFVATVNVEYSTDAAGAGPWAPLATFLQAGNLTIDVAAHWMRAVTSSYQSGAPNVDVGSSDAGSLFALLPAAGTPVDVSALPLLKTVVSPSGFAGNVEVSEDGISWAQIFSFQNGGAVTRSVVAQFARVTGGADVWMGGANDVAGGGGSTTLAVKDEGSAIGSFTTMNFVGAGVTAANAGGGQVDVTIPGGGGAASQLLSIYGDGSFGDHTTAGDEAWTTAAVPGSPTIPVSAPIPFAFFNDLTISPGDSVAVGDLVGAEGSNPAVVVFVKGTLTIGAGARIHANGGNAPGGGLNPFGNPGGAGRRAILDSIDGGGGGNGGGTLSGVTGQPGAGGPSRPAKATATMIGGKGGDTTFQLVPASGGPGGVCEADSSWPYSLSQAITIASILYAIGGGNGGGGGAGAGSGGFGGGGGGGAGTLVIFARNIVAPAGSLQAIGGDGGTGASSENIPGAGGGGGTGGTIVVVTENTTIAGVTDVSGGAGGAGAGFPQSPGFPGGPGEAIGFNPTLAAQIPV